MKYEYLYFSSTGSRKVAQIGGLPGRGGLGEREAAKSFEVFQQNPELANFLLKLTGLEAFLKERTTLILDQGTPPLDLLKSGATLSGEKK